MFKAALSSLSSSLVGAAKSTLESYKPTPDNMLDGAFSRIAQQGIANLAYRSPILSDIAQSVLQSFQVEVSKKQKIQDYVKSSEGDWLRSSTKEKMGAGASDKKIEEEMAKVISKISKEIDKNGVEETRKSGKFAEYEKFFDEFRSTSKAEPQQAQHSSSSSGEGEILTRIEKNTQQTVNALEELAMRGGTAGVTAGATTSAGTATGSFIDPMTGMPSMRAAVGSIGGSFLAKVFDDSTIDKFANKTKKFFGLAEEEEEVAKEKKKAARPKKAKDFDIKDVLGDLNLDLNTNHDAAKVVSTDNTTESAKEGITKISTENTSESAKEIELETNHRADKLHHAVEEVVDELKTLNKTTDKKSDTDKVDKKSDEKDKKKSVVDKALSDGKEKLLSKVPTKLRDIPYKAGNMVGRGVAKTLEYGKQAASYGSRLVGGVPTVAEGGAGAAEGGMLAGAGSLAAGVLGGGAGAAEGGMLAGAGSLAAGVLGGGALAAAAPWVAGAAAVGAIGYGGYKMYQSHVEAAKSTASKELDSLTEAKAKQDSAASTSAPVVINSSNSTSTPTSSGSNPVIIGTPSVRNSESTFERVQMQDFWHRTA